MGPRKFLPLAHLVADGSNKTSAKKTHGVVLDRGMIYTEVDGLSFEMR